MLSQCNFHHWYTSFSVFGSGWFWTIDSVPVWVYIKYRVVTPHTHSWSDFTFQFGSPLVILKMIHFFESSKTVNSFFLQINRKKSLNFKTQLSWLLYNYLFSLLCNCFFRCLVSHKSLFPHYWLLVYWTSISPSVLGALV